MRICHITPHLPPDQAANALLPFHLGEWSHEAGDHVEDVAHPPRAGVATPQPGPVAWIPSRRGQSGLMRALRVASIVETLRILRAARPMIRRADVVHVHSNGLLAEMGGLLGGLARRPVVLTLYGTEIWHYARRSPVDLFTRLYRRATHVTFYSRGLLDRARELGLARSRLSVVYPPVADAFTFHDDHQQAAMRARLGIRQRHLIVNVKRLHPLAGQRYLVQAMALVVRAHPDTLLMVCGTGALLAELQSLAEACGVSAHVHFAGLVENAQIARYCASADLFVLPSLLEACPTVALEALATGTPVVSADNPGGVELHALFGEDVQVVPKERPEALARAIVEHLEHKRRTGAASREVLDREFRPAAVFERFRRIYAEACEAPGARTVPA